MTAVDYILEGLARALELERELGARALPFDRALLVAPAAHAPPNGTPEAAAQAPAAHTLPTGSAPAAPAPAAHTFPRETPAAQAPSLAAQAPAAPAPAAETPPRETPAATPGLFDFVFLHDKPLSPGGIEMMAKIILAMGRTAETAPIVVAGEKPKAKVYVVLGSAALRKWYPGLRGAPGQWIDAPRGESVLVSNSPEYILRFGVVTPAVQAIKKAMWVSLKSVLQRIRTM